MTRFTLLALFVTFLLAAPLAMAEDTAAPEKPKSATPTLLLKQYQASHPEKFLLAFNKIAKLQPDFLEWAKKSPFLKDAKESDKDVIINRESNRLSQAFSAMTPDEALVVHVNIRFDDYSTLQEVLNLSEFTPKTFFSFSIYDQNVAVVPKDIAKFGTINMPKADMDEMLSKAQGSDVKAEILLKPVVADARETFKIGSTPYWLLLSEIGEIRFWSDKPEPQLLWMYRADWYKPKEDKALMDLKGAGGL
ncbi:MAG: hypothetical protein EBQ96_07110 [Proteobacteria bacterium]|nr:hypothetical protein [Pseudomonadota bacterium]